MSADVSTEIAQTFDFLISDCGYRHPDEWQVRWNGEVIAEFRGRFEKHLAAALVEVAQRLG